MDSKKKISISKLKNVNNIIADNIIADNIIYYDIENKDLLNLIKFKKKVFERKK